jgi:dihydrolipoamide dehydrogenase
METNGYYDYDVCVIGGGPAGYAAAVRALDLRKKVLLIEKNKLGGAGVYDGALTSKSLWELSKDVSRLKNKERGYYVHDFSIDYEAIIGSVQAAASEKSGQMAHQFKVFEEKVHAGRFRFAQGFARLRTEHEIEILTNDGIEIVTAENIVLAMGTRPRKIPTIPIDEKIIVTSDGISSFDHFPESLVVLGAGIIGCEFATIFSNFGQTKVYLIDKADRILPFEDEDVSEFIAQNFERNGVTIHRKSALQSMTIEDGRVKYVLTNASGETEVHYAEKGLVSIGRVPNIEDMGLQEIGLRFDERGNMIVQDTRSSIPNIYVVGDLTAEVCLVNVGELEGRHAIEKMYGLASHELSYDNVSTIMFLEPEVAGVGMNEKQAKAAGLSYRVACFPYEYINRAIAMRNTKGFFKILVTDDEEMRILGMRALGPQASSSIQAVALLISMQKGINELAELIHPHPSIVEGIQECVRMLLGKSIIKPTVFNNLLRCNRVVNGECVAYETAII